MSQISGEAVMGRLQDGLEVARRLGASAARIQYGRNESTNCEFASGRLKSTDARQSVWYNIDVLSGGRLGAASGNDLGALPEMVRRAVTLAKVGSVAHFEAYPKPAPHQAVKTHSERAAAMATGDFIGNGSRVVEAIRQHDPDVYIEGGAGRQESHYWLATSGGVTYASRGTNWWLWSYAQRTRGTDMLFAGESRWGRDIDELYDPDFISRRIIADLRDGERITEAPVGRVPVLATPELLSGLLSAIVLSVNGRNVAKGDSPLKGRLGEQILAPCISIIDNPHRDYAPGAAEIDVDGIPTRRIALVDQGVLKSFLYDLDSAGLAGAEPTGNNGCAPYSLEVLPGDQASAQLIADMRDGLLVKNVIGFGQGNLINGDFSGNVALGYRIRNGQIVGRVKDTMIAGNVYELLRGGVKLSSDIDPQRRMPYALIDGVSVSTK